MFDHDRLKKPVPCLNKGFFPGISGCRFPGNSKENGFPISRENRLEIPVIGFYLINSQFFYFSFFTFTYIV
jgi:hypothetical protein